ncbi:hypothetical protein R1flu_026830 [Riccia fluitans]|uniref:Uncharacterized protein n=1 Tax=Riccia fluitans TaxID=41844 RepID=A0ABD1XH09_9MARC
MGMQETDQNGESISGFRSEFKASRPVLGARRPSNLELTESPTETNGRRASLSDTIKRLLRPRSQRKRSSSRSPLILNTEVLPEDKVYEEEKGDAAQKKKNPFRTTSFAITFSCECATRRAVEVEGVPVGEELSSVISREIIDNSKTKSKSMIWPTVKVSGKVRRGSSASKLNGDGNSQIVIVQPEDPSSSSAAKRWVVDTLNKISGSLHCQKSVPPS